MLFYGQVGAILYKIDSTINMTDFQTIIKGKTEQFDGLTRFINRV